MKNLLKKFRILLIVPFVLVLFSFAHSAKAADIYWYSTGNTAWASSTNWYSDVDHTIQAGTLPAESDNVYLLGAVSPILDLDVTTMTSYAFIDSSGLTGDANTTGIIATSLRGNYLSSQIQGNATFNQNSTSGGVIAGRAEFNDNSHPGNDIYGSPVIFNDNSYNPSYIGGDATFNDNSYNGSYIDGSAEFNGHSYNYNSTVAIDATFNDNAYDYNGSYGGQTTFNNTNQPFIFNQDNGGDWSNPDSWQEGIVPSPNDDVYVSGGVCILSNSGDSNNITIRSITFANATCLNTSGTLTATNGIFFDSSSTNYNGLVGDVIFNLGSQNYGTVTGTSTFLNNSYNAGNIEGNQAVFANSSVTEGSVYVPVDFINATNAGYISGNANFYGSSYNNSEVSGDSIFGSQSSNSSQLDGNATFYDSSQNSGNISGSTALFVGDSSENTAGVSATLVRKYISDTTTNRDLTSYGYWTVIADNAVVDVTNATFNIHTTFQTLGTGSFIGAGGFPGVTINSPTEGSTVTTWSPSVAWHTGFNDYVTCQYSFNTINWFGASCAGNGSDLIATTTYGSQTLTVRAIDNNSDATTTAVTYNFTPARVLYFYNSGSDASWTTVGNWYTNSSHTVAAGSVPTSIDNVTVVGSTVPSVNLDTWVQPSNIYTQIGIVFTSASSASTTATTTGRATFNNTAQNNATIYGNVTFNNTSSNGEFGRIVGNASFNATTTNIGTVVLNATFYGDAGSNDGTISGVKTRYYTATTTTNHDFTGGWTVVADGVTVTVSSSTYDGTTKFKTLNNGYFIGGPTVVYWSSSVPNSLWTNTTNWYSDSTATVHINRVASSTETVIVVGSTSPQVDLDNANWVTPAGIDASLTGIIFTSSNGELLTTSVMGSTTLNGNMGNATTILGDVTFNGTTLNTSTGVISGSATFNTNSNNYGLVTGDAVFNSSATNRETGVIYGNATFNGSSANVSSANGILGTAYFYSTSYNGGTIDNDAYFYNDLSEDEGTILGSKTRYYTEDATTSLDFVTTGPWTVVADGAIVHLEDDAVFNATTTFSEINSGNFTGEGVPGSYTSCTRPLVLAGTYTFTGDVTNICDIQADGVTINGGGYTLGSPPPQPFPDNKSSSGWIDMTDNFLLYHMNESSGNIIDSSGDNRTGTVNGSVTYGSGGDIGNSLTFDGTTGYIAIPSFPNIYLNPFSVSLWFYHDTLPSDSVLMSQYAGGQTSWMLVEQTYSCGRHFVFQVTEWYGTRSNCATISTGNWYNLVATWDGVQTGRMYINGQLVETATGMVNFSAATNNQMRISGYMGSGSKYIGKMDEVAMWSRKLSDAEALNIYNTQSSGGGGALITTNNHSFNLSNITVGGGAITSQGATINLTGVTTTVAINVSGADAAGNAQAGGTITLSSSHTGALTANGGDSTDYGYGGAAGSITVGAGSSATSQTASAGSNGPNLGAGQSNGNSSSGVLGCTDPNATNYNANATIYDGSCRYSNTAVRGCTVPSAINYNSNATVNDGSCSYPSYNTTNPNPTSNNGGSNSNSNNNNANNTPVAFQGSSSGFTLSPEMLGKLLLKNINGIGAPIINGVGVTNFGNVLGGLNPIGNLQLSNISIDFVPQISAFLFAPLPNSILSALNKSPKILSLFASVGVSKEQDLVAIKRNPILLPKDELPAGLFTVTSSSTQLNTYLASDDVHKLVELVKVAPGQVITVSLEPLSKGKVLGLFMGDTITFFESNKSKYYIVIESPKTAGRYVLTTKSSPLSLVIEVVQSSQPVIKKLSLKDKILKWFSTLFH